MAPSVTLFGEAATRLNRRASLRSSVIDASQNNNNNNNNKKKEQTGRRRNDKDASTATANNKKKKKSSNVPVVLVDPDTVSSHDLDSGEDEDDDDDLMMMEEERSYSDTSMFNHGGKRRSFRRSSGSWAGTANALRQGRQKRILMFLIVVLGAAASAAFLYIGIDGARDEMQNAFRSDAMVLSGAIQAAWRDYEIMALWIHQSCHMADAPPQQQQQQQHLCIPEQQQQQQDNITTATTTTTTTAQQSLKNGQAHYYCTREDFQHLYEYIQSVGLDFVSIQYIPNITHAERVYMEEEARQFYARTNPNITYGGIKALDLAEDGSVNSLGTSPPKPWYFPMHYLLPIENNEAAVDIDIYSYRNREVDAAFETMEPYMSDRIRLLRDQDPRVFGIEFIHPGVVTSDEKHPDFMLHSRGLSKMVIRIPTLIKRATTGYMNGCHVYLFDVTKEDTEEDPVFLVGADLMGDQIRLKHEIFYKDIDLGKSKTFQETIAVANKKWRVVVQTLDNCTLYEEQLIHIIVGGGLIFIACIIIVSWFHTHMVRLTRENHIVSQAQAEKSALAMKQVKRERHLNDFIAHEVRNPLSSAMAALSFVSGIAEERVIDPEVRAALLEDIGVVEGSLDYINDLLKNMLDLHKSACNEMTLDIAPTDIMHDIFEPVSKILVPRCGTIDIILNCNPPDLCANIDRLRMKQVILNLTINATKFVDKGFIRLRAQVVNGSTCIFVEDSGPGIPEQKRARLFEKFQESLDLRNQGTGIGLNVCKNLTKLMGGIIYLDQSYNSGIAGCPGAGFIIDLQQEPIFPTPSLSSNINGEEKERASLQSTVVDSLYSHDATISDESNTATKAQLSNGTLHFANEEEGVVDLEACENHDNHHQCEAAALPEELSVLFVDDDAVLRKLFARSVARVVPKWKIHQASFGEEALQLVDEMKYDIIFMDQYMAADEKMLLGTETVAILRQEKKVSCLICGLSANDLEEQFMDAGADAFMIKPFPCKANALERELQRVWGCNNA